MTASRGAGGRIMEVLIAKAEAAGYVHYRLSTRNKLHMGQTLYRRADFREVPLSPDFPGIVEGVEIGMELILSHRGAKENRLA